MSDAEHEVTIPLRVGECSHCYEPAVWRIESTRGSDERACSRHLGDLVTDVALAGTSLRGIVITGPFYEAGAR